MKPFCSKVTPTPRRASTQPITFTRWLCASAKTNTQLPRTISSHVPSAQISKLLNACFLPKQLNWSIVHQASHTRRINTTHSNHRKLSTEPTNKEQDQQQLIEERQMIMRKLGTHLWGPLESEQQEQQQQQEKLEAPLDEMPIPAPWRDYLSEDLKREYQELKTGENHLLFKRLGYDVVGASQWAILCIIALVGALIVAYLVKEYVHKHTHPHTQTHTYKHTANTHLHTAPAFVERTTM